MSDLLTKQQLYVLVKRSIASLVLVFSLAVLITPQAAFAQDTIPPTTGEEAPAETPVLPATCRALLGSLAEGEEAPASSWTPLTLTGADRTNNASLVWNWAIPTSAVEGASYSGFGYALYSGDVLLTNGQLGPEVTQFAYSATGEVNSYRLFVWIIDTTNPVAEPTPVGCEYNDTLFSTVKPVVNGDSWFVDDNTARPLLTTDATDLTYSWVVIAANGTRVTIDDPTVLNPLFTFLSDGTFKFQLTVTDSFGNTNDPIVELVITYFEPFTPGPEKPIPPIVTPPPIDQYVPPAIALAEVKRTSAVGNSYVATLGGEVAATNTDAAANVAGAADAQKDAPITNAAQAVQPSTQGWVILGVPWYWWLLGIAIIITAWQWYRSGAFRKSPDDV